MRWSNTGGILAAAWLAALAVECRAADKPVEARELRRGLVARHADAAKPKAGEVVRLEPTVALALNNGEAPHPRLAPSGTASWAGHLNVLRAGKYRFAVRLRGQFTLRVGGREVLSAKEEGTEASLKEGPQVDLEAGVAKFEATYARPAGAGRVELLWEGPQIVREPLSFLAVGHVPAEVPAALASDDLSERGRFLAEEAACARCHQPSTAASKALATRMGPDLSKAGRRLKPGWVHAWLGDPKMLRPATMMPALFANDESGQVERYAVAKYLSTLGGPVPASKPPSEKDLLNSVARGSKLFNTVGCSACHGSEKSLKSESAPFFGLLAPTGARSTYPLNGLGAKTAPQLLAEYLADPVAINPSGRMPHMLLQGNEALDLARFLCQTKADGVSPTLPDEPAVEKRVAAYKRLGADDKSMAAFADQKSERQWLDLGKRVVAAKGCASCHTIDPKDRAVEAVPAKASLDELKEQARHSRGCLGEDARARGAAPVYGLSPDDRQALRAFLLEGLTGPGSPAPAHAARVALKRFNCLNCHQRDGEGGLSAEIAETLRKFETPENAETVTPPTLTGVGHKLRTPWLKEVLTKAGRARPWMGLRMPQFGTTNVATLADALAALEGAAPDETIHKVEMTTAKVAAGRRLMGKGGFGCTSCHDISGIPNTGTRGPDLATTNRRVRFDWYERWMIQPQRLEPGTKMPSVFTNGKSPLDDVLGGHSGAQSDAMWAYLSLGPGLPLPEGLEPPKGLVVFVKDRPTVIRTFLPEAGSRALAVGYPGGVSLAFDAATCRLAYGWSGNFLDTSPVWAGRGGAPAKLLGPRFWTGPPGCPIGAGAEPPDFRARATDPAYGKPLPEERVFEGERKLAFDGYSTDKDGVPEFHYRVHPDKPDQVAVRERAVPLKSAAVVGFARVFDVQAPAKTVVWLRAGETAGTPEVMDAAGKRVTLDLKSGAAEVNVTDRLVLLPEGERFVALSVAEAPRGARWSLRKAGDTWQALVRLPETTEGGKATVRLNVWAAGNAEPGLLKDLIAVK